METRFMIQDADVYGRRRVLPVPIGEYAIKEFQRKGDWRPFTGKLPECGYVIEEEVKPYVLQEGDNAMATDSPAVETSQEERDEVLISKLLPIMKSLKKSDLIPSGPSIGLPRIDVLTAALPDETITAAIRDKAWSIVK